MPADRIDLHTHSTASDGTTAPSDLVREAAAAGLDVVALTDHDTTDGWDAAAAALPDGLQLVRGAEISCVLGGTSLHLLAYLFDPDEPALAAQLTELRESRSSRAQRMVALLAADGVDVTWDRVADLARGSVGRPHVAQALVEQGLVASVAEAFTPEWIGTHGRYWAGKLELEVTDALALVAGAGGVTVFAHPGAASRGKTVTDDDIADLAAAGLHGLEVDHPDHPPATRDHLRGLAAELGLLVTGSSDYHGTNKSVALGAGLTDPDACEALLGQATGTVVL